MNLKLLSLFALSSLVSLSAGAQKNKVISVNAAKITTPIQPTMWGVFFEDINMGADGGIIC